MNSDLKELLRIFNDHGVKYLVVSGYAVMYYTEPRYTKDSRRFEFSLNRHCERSEAIQES